MIGGYVKHDLSTYSRGTEVGKISMNVRRNLRILNAHSSKLSLPSSISLTYSLVFCCIGFHKPLNKKCKEDV